MSYTDKPYTAGDRGGAAPPAGVQGAAPPGGILIPEKLYGIIGYPLGHTMSPVLHNWGFGRMGVKAVYMAFPTPPEGLAAFVAGVRALPVSGLSVTIPHKEAIMALLDSVSPLAEQTGAVNTVVWEQGQLVGHNTDVIGFLEPMLSQRITPRSALVLGAGGAAKAVLAGLKDLNGSDVMLTNRDMRRAENLAEQFGVNVVAWERRDAVDAHLVVNTTPLGMSGKAVDESPLPASYWSADQLAYDLVYNPRETKFLREAKAAGAATIDGLSMFAAQGLVQFKYWTGLDLPGDEAKAVLAKALGL